MELEPHDFYFPSFLQHIVGMIHVQATRKGVVFIPHQDAHLPRGIYADEKRLREVLLNLLGNAVKFTEEGGMVTFSVKRVVLSSNTALLVEIFASSAVLSAKTGRWVEKRKINMGINIGIRIAFTIFPLFFALLSIVPPNKCVFNRLMI